MEAAAASFDDTFEMVEREMSAVSDVEVDPNSLLAQVFGVLPDAFAQHKRRLFVNGVDDDLLYQISDADLKELGITLGAHRKRILKEVRKQRRLRSAVGGNTDTSNLEGWLRERNLTPLLEPLLCLDIRKFEVLTHCSSKDIDEIAKTLNMDLGLKLKLKK
eukprot:UN26476